MFGFGNPIKNIANQYCRCVKYTFNELGIAGIFPLSDFNIERIFNSLISFKGCALTEGQKEVIELAKQGMTQEMIRMKKENLLTIGSARDVAGILIIKNLEYYHGPLVVTDNINTINSVLEKHFGI